MYDCKMQEKKKFQSSFDNSFLKESKSGNQAIDLFLDRANPYNKVDQNLFQLTATMDYG